MDRKRRGNNSNNYTITTAQKNNTYRKISKITLQITIQTGKNNNMDN